MKKLKADMSGFCRHSGMHEKCWGEWETPSVVVRCECDCHKGQMRQTDSVERVIVPKIVPKVKKQVNTSVVPKVLVKKS